MKETIWVLTNAVSDYNQYGDYLIAVFTSKPTYEQLKSVLDGYNSDFINKILNGETTEDWNNGYGLYELEVGKKYKNR